MKQEKEERCGGMERRDFLKTLGALGGASLLS